MSSWIVEDKRTWAEWLALRILKVGPIPSHLALIMDGNRRFARQNQQKVIYGHTEGFKTLTNVLAWCRDIGINEVTVYAFSIENFKRSKDEVNGLMTLACEKFEQLLNEKDRLAEHGVCVRVVGNLSLLPEKVRKLAAEAVLATQDNNVCTLNVAMAYTSRDELAMAIKTCAEGVANGIIRPCDVTINLLEHCLYTQLSKPDLVVRTSGETRLSDFLLWQSQFSYLFFTKVLWPELSIWQLLAAVFQYQRHHHHLTTARIEAESYAAIVKGSNTEIEESGVRQYEFKEKIREERNRELQVLAGVC